MDVLVTRGADRLATKVYRKATHTDRYIHFTSKHHNRVKRGVIKCLKQRATRICETEDLEAEEDHLRVTFRKNSYPEKFIADAMMPRTRQEAPQADGTVTEASNPRRKTLLYVKGTSDKIADICRKAGVQPVFQQKPTLRGLLTRVKGPQKHMDKGVVYQIPCAQCNEVYIGETGRPLKTRISEHKRAVATGDVRNANDTHWMRTNHNMDWGAAHVVDRSNRWKERKI